MKNVSSMIIWQLRST